MQLFESFGIVVLQFLNENLQKWNLMENASLEAKDQLVGLTSVDGDWFLEEMCSLLANCNNLTRLVEKVFNKFNLLKLSDTTTTTNITSDIWFIRLLEINDTLKTLFEYLKQLIFVYDTGLCESLARLIFFDFNSVQFIVDQFNEMNIDEFFELISVETFSVENFNQVSCCFYTLIKSIIFY